MVSYDTHTMGKLIIQDWNVVAGYPDVPLLYILTPQQAAALVAICPPQKWLTRWDNPPTKDTLDAFVSETMFNLMNPITCAMLNECLADAFQAQTDAILLAVANQENFGTQNPGQPLTELELGTNITEGTNPTCDEDILWAQCLAIVQYTNRAITDVIEKIEAATNVFELAGLTDEVPLIGWVMQQFGTELATQTINYFQEAIGESYAAQYTEEVELELACALFCLFSSNCSVNVDDLYHYFFNRAASNLPNNPGEFIDLLEMLAGIDFDGTNVVDLMFWFAWGIFKLGSFFVGVAVTLQAFQLIADLAVNDANNDWELLCDTCVTPTWCKTWDFTIDDGGFSVYGGFGTYVPTVGWVCPGQTVLWLYREDFGGVKITTATFSVEGEESTIQLGTPFDTLAAFAGGNFGYFPFIDVSANGGFANVNNMAIRAAIDGIQVWGGTIKTLEICGEGLEPIWEV